MHACDKNFARSDDAMTPNRDGVNGTIGAIGDREAAHDLESAHRSIASNRYDCFVSFKVAFI